MDGTCDNKGDASESFAWLLFPVGILLAFVNLVLYDQIQKRLHPRNGVDNIQKKRSRYTIFVGTNIFLYIWTVQIISATAVLPFCQSLVLSVVTGYVIANALLPDALENEVIERQAEDSSERKVKQGERQVQSSKPKEQRQDDEEKCDNTRKLQRQKQYITGSQSVKEQRLQEDGKQVELLKEEDGQKEGRTLTLEPALFKKEQRHGKDALRGEQSSEDDVVAHNGTQEGITKLNDTFKEEHEVTQEREHKGEHRIETEQQQDDERLNFGQDGTPGELDRPEEKHKIVQDLEHAVEQVLKQEQRQNEKPVPEEHGSDGIVEDNAPVVEENITQEPKQALEQVFGQNQRQAEEYVPQEDVTEKNSIPEGGAQDKIAEQCEKPEEEEVMIVKHFERVVEQVPEKEQQQAAECVLQAQEKEEEKEVHQAGDQDKIAKLNDKVEDEGGIKQEIIQAVEQILEQENQLNKVERQEALVPREDRIVRTDIHDIGALDKTAQQDNKPETEANIKTGHEREFEQVLEKQGDKVRQEDGLDRAVMPEGGAQDDMAKLEIKPAQKENILQDVEYPLKQVLEQDHQQDKEGVRQVARQDSGLITKGEVQDGIAQPNDKPIEEEEVTHDLDCGEKQLAIGQKSQQDDKRVRQEDGTDSGVMRGSGVQDNIGKLKVRPVEEERITQDLGHPLEKGLYQELKKNEGGVWEEERKDNGVMPDRAEMQSGGAPCDDIAQRSTISAGGAQDGPAHLDDKSEEKKVTNDFEDGVEQFLEQEHRQHEEGVREKDGSDSVEMPDRSTIFFGGTPCDDISKLDGKPKGVEVIRQEYEHGEEGVWQYDGLESDARPRNGVQGCPAKLKDKPEGVKTITSALARGVEQVIERERHQDEGARQEGGVDVRLMPEKLTVAVCGIKDVTARLDGKTVEDKKVIKDFEGGLKEVLEKEYRQDGSVKQDDGLDSGVMSESKVQDDLVQLGDKPIQEDEVRNKLGLGVGQVPEQEDKQDEEAFRQEDGLDSGVLPDSAGQEYIVTSQIIKAVEEEKVAKDLKRGEVPVLEQEHQQDQEGVREEGGLESDVMPEGSVQGDIAQLNDKTVEEDKVTEKFESGKEQGLEQEHQQGKEGVWEEGGLNSGLMTQGFVQDNISKSLVKHGEEGNIAQDLERPMEQVREKEHQQDEEGVQQQEELHSNDDTGQLEDRTEEEEKVAKYFKAGEEQGLEQEHQQEQRGVRQEDGRGSDVMLEGRMQDDISKLKVKSVKEIIVKDFEDGAEKMLEIEHQKDDEEETRQEDGLESRVVIERSTMPAEEILDDIAQLADKTTEEVKVTKDFEGGEEQVFEKDHQQDEDGARQENRLDSGLMAEGRVQGDIAKLNVKCDEEEVTEVLERRVKLVRESEGEVVPEEGVDSGIMPEEGSTIPTSREQDAISHLDDEPVEENNVTNDPESGVDHALEQVYQQTKGKVWQGDRLDGGVMQERTIVTAGGAPCDIAQITRYYQDRVEHGDVALLDYKSIEEEKDTKVYTKGVEQGHEQEHQRKQPIVRQEDGLDSGEMLEGSVQDKEEEGVEEENVTKYTERGMKQMLEQVYQQNGDEVQPEGGLDSGLMPERTMTSADGAQDDTAHFNDKFLQEVDVTKDYEGKEEQVFEEEQHQDEEGAQQADGLESVVMPEGGVQDDIARLNIKRVEEKKVTKDPERGLKQVLEQVQQQDEDEGRSENGLCNGVMPDKSTLFEGGAQVEKAQVDDKSRKEEKLSIDFKRGEEQVFENENQHQLKGTRQDDGLASGGMPDGMETSNGLKQVLEQVHQQDGDKVQEGDGLHSGFMPEVNTISAVRAQDDQAHFDDKSAEDEEDVRQEDGLGNFVIPDAIVHSNIETLLVKPVEEWTITHDLERPMEQVLETENQHDAGVQQQDGLHTDVMPEGSTVPAGGAHEYTAQVDDKTTEEEKVTKSFEGGEEQVPEQEDQREEEGERQNDSLDSGVILGSGVPDDIARLNIKCVEEKEVTKNPEREMKQMFEQEHKQKDDETRPYNTLYLDDKNVEEEMVTKDFEDGEEQMFKQEDQQDETVVRREYGLGSGVIPKGGIQDDIARVNLKRLEEKKAHQHNEDEVQQGDSLYGGLMPERSTMLAGGEHGNTAQVDDKSTEEENAAKYFEGTEEQVFELEYQSDEEVARQEDWLDRGVMPETGVQDEIARLNVKHVEEKKVTEDPERGMKQVLEQVHQQDELQREDSIDRGVMPERSTMHASEAGDDSAHSDDKNEGKEKVTKDFESWEEQMFDQGHQRDEKGVRQDDGLDSGVIQKGGMQDNKVGPNVKRVEGKKVTKDSERDLKQMLELVNQQEDDKVRPGDSLDGGMISGRTTMPAGGAQEDPVHLDDTSTVEKKVTKDFGSGEEHVFEQEHQQDEEGVQQKDGLESDVMPEGGVQDDRARLNIKTLGKDKVTKDLEHGLKQVLEQVHQKDGDEVQPKDGLHSALMPKRSTMPTGEAQEGVRQSDTLENVVMPEKSVQDDRARPNVQRADEKKVTKDPERGLKQVLEQVLQQDEVKPEDSLDSGGIRERSTVYEGETQDDPEHLDNKTEEEEKVTENFEGGEEQEQVIEQVHQQDEEGVRQEESLDSGVMPEGGVQDGIARLNAKSVEEEKVHRHDEDDVQLEEGPDSGLTPERSPMSAGGTLDDKAQLDENTVEKVTKDFEGEEEQVPDKVHQEKQKQQDDGQKSVVMREGGVQDDRARLNIKTVEEDKVTKDVEHRLKQVLEQVHQQDGDEVQSEDGLHSALMPKRSTMPAGEAQEGERQSDMLESVVMPEDGVQDDIARLNVKRADEKKVTKDPECGLQEVLEQVHQQDEEGVRQEESLDSGVMPEGGVQDGIAILNVKSVEEEKVHRNDEDEVQLEEGPDSGLLQERSPMPEGGALDDKAQLDDNTVEEEKVTKDFESGEEKVFEQVHQQDEEGVPQEESLDSGVMPEGGVQDGIARLNAKSVEEEKVHRHDEDDVQLEEGLDSRLMQERSPMPEGGALNDKVQLDDNTVDKVTKDFEGEEEQVPDKVHQEKQKQQDDGQKSVVMREGGVQDDRARLNIKTVEEDKVTKDVEHRLKQVLEQVHQQDGDEVQSEDGLHSALMPKRSTMPAGEAQEGERQSDMLESVVMPEDGVQDDIARLNVKRADEKKVTKDPECGLQEVLEQVHQQDEEGVRQEESLDSGVMPEGGVQDGIAILNVKSVEEEKVHRNDEDEVQLEEGPDSGLLQERSPMPEGGALDDKAQLDDNTVEEEKVTKDFESGEEKVFEQVHQQDEEGVPQEESLNSGVMPEGGVQDCIARLNVKSVEEEKVHRHDEDEVELEEGLDSRLMQERSPMPEGGALNDKVQLDDNTVDKVTKDFEGEEEQVPEKVHHDKQKQQDDGQKSVMRREGGVQDGRARLNIKTVEEDKVTKDLEHGLKQVLEQVHQHDGDEVQPKDGLHSALMPKRSTMPAGEAQEGERQSDTLESVVMPEDGVQDDIARLNVKRADEKKVTKDPECGLKQVLEQVHQQDEVEPGDSLDSGAIRERSTMRGGEAQGDPVHLDNKTAEEEKVTQNFEGGEEQEQVLEQVHQQDEEGVRQEESLDSGVMPEGGVQDGIGRLNAKSVEEEKVHRHDEDDVQLEEGPDSGLMPERSPMSAGGALEDNTVEEEKVTKDFEGGKKQEQMFEQVHQQDEEGVRQDESLDSGVIHEGGVQDGIARLNVKNVEEAKVHRHDEDEVQLEEGPDSGLVQERSPMPEGGALDDKAQLDDNTVEKVSKDFEGEEEQVPEKEYQEKQKRQDDGQKSVLMREGGVQDDIARLNIKTVEEDKVTNDLEHGLKQVLEQVHQQDGDEVQSENGLDSGLMPKRSTVPAGEAQEGVRQSDTLESGVMPEDGVQDDIARLNVSRADEKKVTKDPERGLRQVFEQVHEQDEVQPEYSLGSGAIRERSTMHEGEAQDDPLHLDYKTVEEEKVAKDIEGGEEQEQVFEQVHQQDEEGVRQEESLDSGVMHEGSVQDGIARLNVKNVEEAKVHLHDEDEVQLEESPDSGLMPEISTMLVGGEQDDAAQIDYKTTDKGKEEQVFEREYQQDEEIARREDGLDSGVMPEAVVDYGMSGLKVKSVEQKNATNDLEVQQFLRVEQLLETEHQQDKDVRQGVGLGMSVMPERYTMPAGRSQEDTAQLDESLDEEKVTKDFEGGEEQMLEQEHRLQEDFLDSVVMPQDSVQNDIVKLKVKPMEVENVTKGPQSRVEKALEQGYKQTEEEIWQGLDSGWMPQSSTMPAGGSQDDIALLDDKKDFEGRERPVIEQEHQQDKEIVHEKGRLDSGVMPEFSVQGDTAQLDDKTIEKQKFTKDFDEQLLEPVHQQNGEGINQEDGIDSGVIPGGGMQYYISMLQVKPAEEGEIIQELEHPMKRLFQQEHQQDEEGTWQGDRPDNGVMPKRAIITATGATWEHQEHQLDKEGLQQEVRLDIDVMPERSTMLSSESQDDIAKLDDQAVQEERILQDSEHTMEQILEQEHRHYDEGDPQQHVLHKQGMPQEGSQDEITKLDNKPEEKVEITKYIAEEQRVEENNEKCVPQGHGGQMEFQDRAQENRSEQDDEPEEKEKTPKENNLQVELDQEQLRREKTIRQEHGTDKEIALQDHEPEEEIARDIGFEEARILEKVQKQNEVSVRQEHESEDQVEEEVEEGNVKPEERLEEPDFEQEFGHVEQREITQVERLGEESVGQRYGYDNASAMEERQEEEDPFENILRQLGLSKGSRLNLLDQRSIKGGVGLNKGLSEDVISNFFEQLSAWKADTTHNLSKTFPLMESKFEDHAFAQGKTEYDQNKEKEHVQVDKLSNRDVLFAILTSCDQFLLQEVLRQLAMCGNAVPVLMPRLDGENTCPLWGLRKTTVIQSDRTPSSVSAGNVTTTSFLTVSAIRFGQPGLSKSTILNSILKRLKCSEQGNTFMSERKTSLWSRGTVEAAWHLPSDGNRHSKVPLAFFNLRGDSVVCQKQAKFCIKSSKVLIVFMGTFESVNMKAIFADVSPDIHVIMVSPSPEVESPFTDLRNITIIDTTDRTEEQISQSIFEIITGRYFRNTKKESLEDISELCNDLGIVVDETLPECRRGKTTALEITDAIRGKSKQDLFPLQNLWRKWVEVNNETLGEQNIEHELSTILEKKKKIRSSQKNSVLSTVMDKFIESLDTDGDYKYYTYYWLELLLNRHSGSLDLAKSKEEARPAATCCGDFDIDIIDFHQELEQMVESEHPRLKQTQDKESKSIFEHFIELQSSGIPIQLFDSIACAVPLEWLEDASMHLDTTEGKPRVRVISVIGNPKSFKTTLLNRLYGLNFSTRSQVSTKGMLLHLVPVKYPANEQMGCDFLLVIDTQSFNIADDPSPDDMKRNEYITTLTLCISDLVIVNDRQLKNTSNGGSKLLDPGFVRGLARMKEVNKSGKCLLVQHCEAELTENTDNETLSEQLFEKAMKNLSENPQSDLMVGSSEDIFDVFSVDNKKRAMIIPYTGTESRSGATRQNCERITATRKVTLQLIAQCNRAQMSFVDFCQRIADVTNALKKEEFVKHFRDTNIENLKDEFVLWYRDLLLKLQSDLTTKLTFACNELGKVPFENITEAKDIATNELAREVEDGFGNVKLQIQEQLHSKNYDCLSDQEKYFQKDIGSAKESFLQKIPENFERVLRQVERNEKSKKGTQQERDAFLSKLSKNIKTKRKDEAVQKEFEKAQEKFLDYLRRKYPMHAMSVVHQNTEDNTMYMLEQCGVEVEALLSSNTLPDYVDSHKQMKSYDDVNELKDKFIVANSAAEEAFKKVKCRLTDDCEKPAEFSETSKKFIQLLRSLQPDFQNSVGNVNMYLFVLAKFISEMHKAQLEKEKESRISLLKDDGKESHIRDIEEEVSEDGYEIKHAEPLDFPTIDSKIVSVLSDLEGFCSDEELEVLKEVFTSKNIRNCSALPFDLVTMQRLDRSFICMLPPLDSEDMKSINAIVTEAKMIMFGKAMSKQRFDHGKTFNEIYSLTQKAIIDDKIDGKKARAAALVHLFSWSTGIIDVKKFEELKAENVACSFEREQGKLCLVQFKSQHKHNCDGLIAEIICDEVRHSLCGVVEESFVTRLREYFLLEAGVLNLKRTYIGTVLRDLCLKEDYLGFAYFLKTFKEFSEKWILNFIARESNKVENSLLRNIFKEVLDAKMSLIKTVIEETSSEFEKQSDRNLPKWLDIFQTKLSYKVNTSCRASTVVILRDSTKVERFDNFTEQMAHTLDAMREKLEGSMCLPIPGNAGDTKTFLLSLSHQIHVELSAVVRGCIEQCPFCGAACESTLSKHEFHETVLHYPGGVKGWHDVTSRKLFTDICTSAVASTQQYRTPENQFRPYREYKMDYPKWEIPGKIGEPMAFWQYVFNKFNGQFARHYGCEKGDVPSQWSRITKEEALRSVEKAYKLSPIIMGD